MNNLNFQKSYLMILVSCLSLVSCSSESPVKTEFDVHTATDATTEAAMNPNKSTADEDEHDGHDEHDEHDDHDEHDEHDDHDEHDEHDEHDDHHGHHDHHDHKHKIVKPEKKATINNLNAATVNEISTYLPKHDIGVLPTGLNQVKAVDTVLDASEIVKEYNSRKEVAFNNSYKDKVIQINGRILSIKPIFDESTGESVLIELQGVDSNIGKNGKDRIYAYGGKSLSVFSRGMKFDEVVALACSKVEVSNKKIQALDCENNIENVYY